QEVLSQLKATPARMVHYSSYQDSRPADWLGRNAGMPVVMVPFTVGGSEKAGDLFGLFDDLLARLLAAASQK
ncbi:MAG: zinc ABC transporter substrate-binding protein, partial [Ramlibacter sp.]